MREVNAERATDDEPRSGRGVNARQPILRVLLAALFVTLVATATGVSPGAWASGHRGGHRLTCRGPASLSELFQLAAHRKVTAKRVGCATARKVVKRFPKSCAKAYAAQGKCKIRSDGRWRCRSRIVGPLAQGAPSKEGCRHRRARIKFEVAYFPPTEPAARASSAAAKGPYDARDGCVKTGQAGTVIPPPALAAGAFEIHVLGGVPRAVGEDLQQTLVDHGVSPILHAGLGSNPLGYPRRIPIFVTNRAFESRRAWGITAQICADAPPPDAPDGIVVRTNLPAGYAGYLAQVAAHELFHAYSLGITGQTDDTWWDEASATWSPTKSNFNQNSLYDRDLQFPNEALDTTEPRLSYQYAMSRFVQFLEDRGLVDAPHSGSWPLEREVIGGYVNPGATMALATALKDRGTTLGAQLAAFWGDRIRATPLHGPQLRPGAPGTRTIKVEPGESFIPAVAQPLHTKLFDFKLADNVKRVEFEFDPPANGFFWGATKPNQSQQFLKDESVSFCVGGGDENDLKWPGEFPVTFTNGSLNGGEIQGTITVRAQKSAEQCTSPLLNRACSLLDRAGVQDILGGPGDFHATFEGPIDDGFGWQCSYVKGPQKPNKSAVLGLGRLRLSDAKVRRKALKLIHDSDLRRIKIGDVAGIGKSTDGTISVVMAVGKEIAVLDASAGRCRFSCSSADAAEVTEQDVVRLARRIAGELG